MNRNSRLDIRVPAILRDRLRRLAESNGLTTSSLAAWALEEYVNEAHRRGGKIRNRLLDGEPLATDRKTHEVSI
jgi:hypothetical protein